MKHFYIAFVLMMSFKATAHSKRNPPNLDFLDIKTMGSGCKMGSVANVPSKDKDAITIAFSEFEASTDLPKIENDNKDCRIRFEVESDQRWQLGIVGVEMRGFIQADQGAQVSTQIQYHDDTGDYKDFGVETYKDDIEDFFIRSHAFDVKNVKWFGCRKNKWFEMEMSISADSGMGKGEASISVDSVDAEIEQTFSFIKRPCKPIRSYIRGRCEINIVKKNDPDQVVKDFTIKVHGRTWRGVRKQLTKKYHRRCRRLYHHKWGLSCAPLVPEKSCEFTES